MGLQENIKKIESLQADVEVLKKANSDRKKITSLNSQLNNEQKEFDKINNAKFFKSYNDLRWNDYYTTKSIQNPYDEYSAKRVNKELADVRDYYSANMKEQQEKNKAEHIKRCDNKTKILNIFKIILILAAAIVGAYFIFTSIFSVVSVKSGMDSLTSGMSYADIKYMQETFTEFIITLSIISVSYIAVLILLLTKVKFTYTFIPAIIQVLVSLFMLYVCHATKQQLYLEDLTYITPELNSAFLALVDPTKITVFVLGGIAIFLSIYAFIHLGVDSSIDYINIPYNLEHRGMEEAYKKDVEYVNIHKAEMIKNHEATIDEIKINIKNAEDNLITDEFKQAVLNLKNNDVMVCPAITEKGVNWNLLNKFDELLEKIKQVIMSGRTDDLRAAINMVYEDDKHKDLMEHNKKIEEQNKLLEEQNNQMLNNQQKIQQQNEQIRRQAAQNERNAQARAAEQAKRDEDIFWQAWISGLK